MATMIETYEKCQECKKGQISVDGVIRSCLTCDGKGYTNHIITIDDLWDMLEEIRKRKERE